MFRVFNLKKQLTWDLLNVRLDKFLTESSAKEEKTIFGNKVITYADRTCEDHYEFVVHTVSDRAIKRIIENNNVFDGSPYISCSLVNQDLGMFTVNPSLLQANLLFEFPADAVCYAAGSDIGSPTNKYNTKEEQVIFLKKLNRQTFFANTIDAKLRETSQQMNIAGTRNWNNLPKIVDTITATAITEKLKSADPKKDYIEALPLLSVDMLRNNTQPNQQYHSCSYNEILIKHTDIKIKAIAFNEVDWKKALRAIELDNRDAINAMNAIITAKIPIVIIQNKFAHKNFIARNSSPEEALTVACKNHDIDLLNQLVFRIDIKNFGGRALQEACYQGDFAIVKLLISHGADVNYDNGKCLKSAIYRNHAHIIKFLIKQGADVLSSLTELENYLHKYPDELLQTTIERAKNHKLKP